MRSRIRGPYDETAADILRKNASKGAKMAIVIVGGEVGANGIGFAVREEIYLETRASLPAFLEDIAKQIRAENQGRDRNGKN